MADYTKPLPRPTPITQPFWDGTKEHILRLQQCRRCQAHIFYPRNVCPACLHNELDWVTASGRGTVYSFTVAHRPTNPAFAADVPMVIAIIALEEGPHMTSNVTGCPPESVRIGMPVTAVFEDVTPEVTLVKFQPLTP